MSWKSLICALSEETCVARTLEFAARLARANDAHLDVLSLGVGRDPSSHYFTGAGVAVLQDVFTACYDEADRIEAIVKDTMGRLDDLRWTSASGVAQLADLGRHVADRARFADLAVVPAPYAAGLGPDVPLVTEAMLFDAGIPALILPDVEGLTTTPQRITFAWNDGPEALRAARAALPLMKQADRVHVVVVDPPEHALHRSDPGGLISQYLARHGVRVEVDVLSKSLPRVADVLLRHATDTKADLIVMGAYGHSRIREAVFGGATRHMLEQTHVPLFMAH